MKLIIQIPCYNEEENLKATLDDLPKHLDGIDMIEYLIIDDGCTDNTIGIAKDWGVDHIVNLKKHAGLADGFMAGIDECLRNGADIIVNTDADNQYCGKDVETIIKPILEEKADIVIGERPINERSDFSRLKKLLQRIGSWAVRKASNTDIPDAPSGFRAYSRDAALHLNIINGYTYTLEQIIQAGRTGMSIISVPVHINEGSRPSRLFGSIFDYIKKSVLAIAQAYMMYRPLKVFITMGIIPVLIGILIGIRFLIYFTRGYGNGHIQSLLLAVMLILLGGMIAVVGLLADLIAANRKILMETQYRIRKLDYGIDKYKLRMEKQGSVGEYNGRDGAEKDKNICKQTEDC